MTKISQLTNIGSALAGDDEFVVRDVSDVSTPNKKVTSSGIVDYIISQGALSGFSQIAAGVGPLARVRTTTSGTTGTIIAETASAGTIAEAYRVTPDKYLRMAASTGGIQFNGDTAAANALDDYEEGTFTPAVVGSTTAGTASYSVQSGFYTKIGRLVHVTIFLAWSGGTGAGVLRFAGLPFQVPNISNYFFPVSIGYVDNVALTAGNYIMGYAVQNLSAIEFVQNPTGGGAKTDVPYDAAGGMIVSCSYYAAT
jgi:hypothetical protein